MEELENEKDEVWSKLFDLTELFDEREPIEVRIAAALWELSYEEDILAYGMRRSEMRFESAARLHESMKCYGELKGMLMRWFEEMLQASGR